MTSLGIFLHRTQGKNKEDCIQKLRELVAEAMIEPKEREMWAGIGEKGKEIRKKEKTHRKEVKQNRKVRFDFD
jgi:hypothetical protein